ncbi:MAG: L-threonylcarbamoyladenylate synthase [bacterium]
MNVEIPAERIKKAAATIRRGGIILFPTDTTYGLGADPFNDRAVERLYRIKRRDAAKPVLLLIDKPEDLDALTAGIPPSASVLMEKFWPGPLTLILPAAARLRPHHIFKTGRVAVRLPDQRIARRIAAAAGVPLTATSANISGSPSCLAPSSLPDCFLKEIDLVIDAGKCSQTRDSTIVDTTRTPPVMIREGAIPYSRIKEQGIDHG